MLSLDVFWRVAVLLSATPVLVICLDFPGCPPRCHGKIKEKMRDCETSQLGALSKSAAHGG